MLKLAINTATTTNNIALLSESEVLAEQTWLAEQNQAEVLQPKIKGLLKDNGYSWEDLTDILVIKGPGAFTSLRVGVVAANTIAFSIKKNIAGISTFDVFKARLNSPNGGEKLNKLHLFLCAGKEKAYFLPNNQSMGEIFTLPQIATKIKEENITTIYGDFTSHQQSYLQETCDALQIIPETELLSFGEALIKVAPDCLELSQQIEPYYIQPANITMPCST